MSTLRTSAEKELLRLYRLAFRNAETNPNIKTKLSENGFDIDNIDEGKKLLEQADYLYKLSKSERIKLAEALVVLNAKRELLNKLFRKQRKLARIAFKFNKVFLDKLSIGGRVSQNFGPWISAASTFYDVLSSEPDLLQKLNRFNITQDDVNQGLQLVEEVHVADAEYTNLKGESQKTTDLKEYAFDKLKSWMSDFYAVARVAFMEEPQQLESFGIVVKS